jgi:hypothetical protein
VPDPVPGSSPIIATSGTGPFFFALLESGDLYRIAVGDPPWAYMGNLLNQPTPVQQETWGSVKARYR